MYMYMHFDLCKIHKEEQKRQGNDHLTSPLHPRRFLVPYLEKLNFRNTCTKI